MMRDYTSELTGALVHTVMTRLWTKVRETREPGYVTVNGMVVLIFPEGER